MRGEASQTVDVKGEGRVGVTGSSLQFLLRPAEKSCFYCWKRNCLLKMLNVPNIFTPVA